MTTNELQPFEQERLDKLTDDAKSAATFFHHNPAVVLTFNTPSRIHPRMRAALTELVEFGALCENKDAGTNGIGLAFKTYNLFLLKRVPKLSQKELKRVGLPITVEGSTASSSSSGRSKR